MSTTPPATFEWIDHTADLGVEVRGETPERVYEGVALATIQAIAGPSPIRAVRTRSVEVRGDDRAERAVALAGEVIYLYDVERFLPAEAEVREQGDDRLTVLLRGEGFDPSRHAIEREVKAATYHAAAFEPWGSGWRARIIFDL